MAKPINVLIAEKPQPAVTYGHNHTCSNTCDDSNKAAGNSSNTYSTTRGD